LVQKKKKYYILYGTEIDNAQRLQLNDIKRGVRKKLSIAYIIT